MGSAHHWARETKNATVVEETTKLRRANSKMQNVIVAKRRATLQGSAEIATKIKTINRNKDQDNKSLRKVEKKGQKSSNYFLGAPDLKDKAEGEYTMYRVTGNKNKAITIDINLCGTPQTMELDTEASKTIFNYHTYTKLRGKLGPLKETEALLSTYTGERIPVAGVVSVPGKYGDQEVNLSALVIRGDGPNLLGRDLLGVIRIKWTQIFKVEAKQKFVNHGLQWVLEEHKEVFQLGTLNGIEAKIYVDEKASPRYLKARPVPYALKKGVEVSPVEFSEWAAPIVPVVKTNGDVRICGDYKCTVNQVSKLDNYFIPKTENLLATLGGGEKFTKLHMSQTYQQLKLDEESKKFTKLTRIKDCFNTIFYHSEFHPLLESSNELSKTCCKAYHMLS